MYILLSLVLQETGPALSTTKKGIVQTMTFPNHCSLPALYWPGTTLAVQIQCSSEIYIHPTSRRRIYRRLRKEEHRLSGTFDLNMILFSHKRARRRDCTEETRVASSV
ncbi:hypothetical protein KCU88_g120, partial [Aureobasidium melanogenum]